MRKNTKAKSGEGFYKKYTTLAKKLSKEDLQDMLSILFYEPRLAIANGDYEKLSKKEREDFRVRWQKMFIFDTKRHKKLLSKLEKNFDVFTEKKSNSSLIKELDKSGLFSTFPKVPLLIEVIRERINLIETGQEIPDDLRIKSVECFTSPTSDKDYKIVINGEYENALRVSRVKRAWDCFFQLVENGQLPKNKETQDLYDYLNFNPNNRITTNTKYPLQRVIRLYSNHFEPIFKASIKTDKAYTQRKKKSKNST